MTKKTISLDFSATTKPAAPLRPTGKGRSKPTQLKPVFDEITEAPSAKQTKLVAAQVAAEQAKLAAEAQARIDAGKAPASGKLHLDFRHRVFMRDKTHTYLWLRDGYKFGYFLTMDSGTIEVVKLDMIDIIEQPEVKADKKAKIKAKPAVIRTAYRVFENAQTYFDLTPYEYDFLTAAQKYHTSHLGRTAAAEREMRSILGLPQLADSVTDEDLAPTDKPRRERTERPAKAAGGYTLQELCSELKLDPTEARKKLRGAKVEKPGGRWEWPTKEAAAAVRAVLEA